MAHNLSDSGCEPEEAESKTPTYRSPPRVPCPSPVGSPRFQVPQRLTYPRSFLYSSPSGSPSSVPCPSPAGSPPRFAVPYRLTSPQALISSYASPAGSPVACSTPTGSPSRFRVPSRLTSPRCVPEDDLDDMPETAWDMLNRPRPPYSYQTLEGGPSPAIPSICDYATLGPIPSADQVRIWLRRMRQQGPIMPPPGHPDLRPIVIPDSPPSPQQGPSRIRTPSPGRGRVPTMQTPRKLSVDEIWQKLNLTTPEGGYAKAPCPTPSGSPRPPRAHSTIDLSKPYLPVAYSPQATRESGGESPIFKPGQAMTRTMIVPRPRVELDYDDPFGSRHPCPGTGGQTFVTGARGQTFTAAPHALGRTFTGAPYAIDRTFTTAPRALDRTFTAAPHALAQTFTAAPRTLAQTFLTAPRVLDRTFTAAPRHLDRTFTVVPHHLGQTFTAAPCPLDQAFTAAPCPLDQTFTDAPCPLDQTFTAVRQTEGPVPSPVTPEFEKWTKYEGREFTPPSRELDPYTVFPPDFSPPGSPVFRIQTVRPPDAEWSPPPQDIDPDQLFGAFTAPDAGVSLMGEGPSRIRTPPGHGRVPTVQTPQKLSVDEIWQKLNLTTPEGGYAKALCPTPSGSPRPPRAHSTIDLSKPYLPVAYSPQATRESGGESPIFKPGQAMTRTMIVPRPRVELDYDDPFGSRHPCPGTGGQTFVTGARGQTFTAAPHALGRTFTGAPYAIDQTFTTAPRALDRTFTAAPHALAQTFTAAPRTLAHTFLTAPRVLDRTFTAAPRHLDRTFTAVPHHLGQTFTAAPCPLDQAFTTAPCPLDQTFTDAPCPLDQTFTAVRQAEGPVPSPVTPEFEKWTKYEGREFTPPSRELDPYTVFPPDFSPPGSPVFRIQTVRPPDAEWSPPPQDIDPDQLFGAFTAPDAGVSLMGEPVHRFPPQSPERISSPPPCLQPEQNLMTTWKRLPAQRFLSRSPERSPEHTSSPPPCLPLELSLNQSNWRHLPVHRFPPQSPERISSPPPCLQPEQNLMTTWKRLPAQRFLSRSPERSPEHTSSPPPCLPLELSLNQSNWRHLGCTRVCPPTLESHDRSRPTSCSAPCLLYADATPPCIPRRHPWGSPVSPRDAYFGPLQPSPRMLPGPYSPLQPSPRTPPGPYSPPVHSPDFSTPRRLIEHQLSPHSDGSDGSPARLMNIRRVLHFSSDEAPSPDSGYSSGTLEEFTPDHSAILSGVSTPVTLSPGDFLSSDSGYFGSPESLAAADEWQSSPESGYSAGASASPRSPPLAPPGSPVSPQPAFYISPRFLQGPLRRRRLDFSHEDSDGSPAGSPQLLAGSPQLPAAQVYGSPARSPYRSPSCPPGCLAAAQVERAVPQYDPRCLEPLLHFRSQLPSPSFGEASPGTPPPPLEDESCEVDPDLLGRLFHISPLSHVRSRTFLAAQEVIEDQGQQAVPASQRTPEQVSAGQAEDFVQATQITPEFEKWTKYEGREFTPPSEEIDPYSVFCPGFSPPGSPVFRIQAVRPPDEWSPPPQAIDPGQLFGTFTAPDAGISLMREPAQKFPSRSPTRVSSPPPCPPPEESLHQANWKRLPAQRFPSRSPTRILPPPPCPPPEDCARGICPPTFESYDLSRLFYEGSPRTTTASPLDTTPQRTLRHPCPDRHTDPVAFFHQYVPMSPSFGQESPGPVPSPHRHETSALDQEQLRMLFHIPRADRARGVCPPTPEAYDLSRLFYEASPHTTSSAPCLPYADATPYRTLRRPWVGFAGSGPSSHRSRRRWQSAGTASSRSPAVQGSPDLSDMWWDPVGTSFYNIPRGHMTPAPQHVPPSSPCPQETSGLEWDPVGISFAHNIPRGHMRTPAPQSLYPASPWAQEISGFEWDPTGTSFLHVSSRERIVGSPGSYLSPLPHRSAGFPFPQEVTGYQWSPEESPATAARAFLAQVFGSRSPSPLSDTSVVLARVQSTPVCWPDDLPPDFVAPTVIGGSRPHGARRRLWSPERPSSRSPSPMSLPARSPRSHETSGHQWSPEESPATAARAFLAQVFGSRSPSPLSDTSVVLARVQSTPVCWPDDLPPDFVAPTVIGGSRPHGARRRLWSPERPSSRSPSPMSLPARSPRSHETSGHQTSPATWTGSGISPDSGVSSILETTQHSHALDFITDLMPTDEDERLWVVMNRFKHEPDVLQHILQLPEPQPEDEESEDAEQDISFDIDKMDFCQLNVKIKEYRKIIREAEERTENLYVDIQNMKYLNVALLNKAKQIRTAIIEAWEKFPETLYFKSPKAAQRKEELWKEFEVMKRECECIRTSNEEKSKYLKELTNAICKLREKEHFGGRLLTEEEKEEIMKSMEKDSQEVGELAQLLTQQEQLLANAMHQYDTEKQRRIEYEEFLKKARKAKKAVLEKLDDVKDITEIQRGMKRMLEQKLAAFDKGDFNPQSKSQSSPSNLPAERA